MNDSLKFKHIRLNYQHRVYIHGSANSYLLLGLDSNTKIFVKCNLPSPHTNKYFNKYLVLKYLPAVTILLYSYKIAFFLVNSEII